MGYPSTRRDILAATLSPEGTKRNFLASPASSGRGCVPSSSVEAPAWRGSSTVKAACAAPFWRIAGSSGLHSGRKNFQHQLGPSFRAEILNLLSRRGWPFFLCGASCCIISLFESLSRQSDSIMIVLHHYLSLLGGHYALLFLRYLFSRSIVSKR